MNSKPLNRFGYLLRRAVYCLTKKKGGELGNLWATQPRSPIHEEDVGLDPQVSDI